MASSTRGDSKVPESVQKKVPKDVQEAIPDQVHTYIQISNLDVFLPSSDKLRLGPSYQGRWWTVNQQDPRQGRWCRLYSASEDSGEVAREYREGCS